MFDYLLYRAANNYSGRPEVQAELDRINSVVEEWTTDALDYVSPEDSVQWRSIDSAFQNGYNAGKVAAKHNKVWLNTSFNGRYPVGTAAVIVAATSNEAANLLNQELRSRGLADTAMPDQFSELSIAAPTAVVLCDGDY